MKQIFRCRFRFEGEETQPARISAARFRSAAERFCESMFTPVEAPRGGIYDNDHAVVVQDVTGKEKTFTVEVIPVPTFKAIEEKEII